MKPVPHVIMLALKDQSFSGPIAAALIDNDHISCDMVNVYGHLGLLAWLSTSVRPPLS